MDEEQLALLYPESYSNEIEAINHGHTENIFKDQLEEGIMLTTDHRTPFHHTVVPLDRIGRLTKAQRKYRGF